MTSQQSIRDSINSVWAKGHERYAMKPAVDESLEEIRKRIEGLKVKIIMSASDDDQTRNSVIDEVLGLFK